MLSLTIVGKQKTCQKHMHACPAHRYCPAGEGVEVFSWLPSGTVKSSESMSRNSRSQILTKRKYFSKGLQSQSASWACPQSVAVERVHAAPLTRRELGICSGPGSCGDFSDSVPLNIASPAQNILQTSLRFPCSMDMVTDSECRL